MYVPTGTYLWVLLEIPLCRWFTHTDDGDDDDDHDDDVDGDGRIRVLVLRRRRGLVYLTYYLLLACFSPSFGFTLFRGAINRN